jgi:opacity protein-like surface antigen
LDASVFIGVGYILIDNIDINLKYNYGVTDINKNPEESDLKKNWLTLSIGYTFRD